MSNFIEVRGGRLHYDSSGSGVTILCIHPPLLTGDLFVYQRQQLSDRFRVISFDVRGHGQSEATDERVTYALIAKDLVELMDQMGIAQAYLCGYSTGGSVVLEALLTYPGRFLGGILISAMSEINDTFNKSLIWAASAISRLRGTRILSAAIALGNSDNSSTFRKLFNRAVHGNRLNLHQYFEASYKYNCTHRLHEIHAPVLLIYGEKDTSFHRYADLLHLKLANSTLYRIPKAKHQIPTKNPHELQSLIRLWHSDQIVSHEQQGIPADTREIPLQPARSWMEGEVPESGSELPR